MRCPDENVCKKLKRATKGLFWFFGCNWFYLKIKNEQRRAAKRNERQMETRLQKPKRTTKGIFHSHYHSFAPILNQWEVTDIKSREKLERARTGGNKKPKRATKVKETLEKIRENHTKTICWKCDGSVMIFW